MIQEEKRITEQISRLQKSLEQLRNLDLTNKDRQDKILRRDFKKLCKLLDKGIKVSSKRLDIKGFCNLDDEYLYVSSWNIKAKDPLLEFLIYNQDIEWSDRLMDCDEDEDDVPEFQAWKAKCSVLEKKVEELMGRINEFKEIFLCEWEYDD